MDGSIQSEQAYDAVLRRIETLMEAPQGTPEDDELDRFGYTRRGL